MNIFRVFRQVVQKQVLGAHGGKRDKIWQTIGWETLYLLQTLFPTFYLKS